MTQGAVSIGDVAYVETLALGLPTFRSESVPKGAVEEEGRAVIHTGRPVREKKWTKCFVTLNLIVRDIAEGEADLIRLSGLEAKAIDTFRNLHGLMTDGSPYVIDIDSCETVGMPELESHALSCRLLFQILNIN